MDKLWYIQTTQLYNELFVHTIDDSQNNYVKDDKNKLLRFHLKF